MGELVVSVHEGKDLLDRHFFGKMSPYVQLTFNAERVASRVAANQGKSPVWDDTVVLALPGVAHNRESLTVTVFDDDNVAGSTTVTLESIPETTPLSGWFPLMNPKTNRADAGFVRLTVVRRNNLLRAAPAAALGAAELVLVHPAFRTANPDTPLQSDRSVAALLKMFAPVVYLHAQEQYRPAGIAWYLQRCFFHRGTEIFPRPDPGLLASGVKGDFLEHMPAFLNETRAGVPFTSSGECVAPVYATIRFLEPTSEFVELQYWFFYPYNGPVLNWGGVEHDTKVESLGGTHEGDWEHVTVRIHNVLAHKKSRPALPPQIVAVLFAAHGHKTGKWHQPASSRASTGVMFESEGTHPIVYAARTSHASYPTAGPQRRDFPLPNDHTARDIRWATEQTVEVLAECAEWKTVRIATDQLWAKFSGAWGSTKKSLGGAGTGGSPSGPLQKIKAEIDTGLREAEQNAVARLAQL
eukprot:TRINITY_DN8313_c0_g1_i1.p1 TRINITY_DN8313_c0_g1~~TRINITY_DN8313_c0_g1_i1.p1  ORF type:complete len:468 (-),score=115.41 TRINITY_DN8313_c0_g1_i1:53-1456(-)